MNSIDFKDGAWQCVMLFRHPKGYLIQAAHKLSLQTIMACVAACSLFLPQQRRSWRLAPETSTVSALAQVIRYKQGFHQRDMPAMALAACCQCLACNASESNTLCDPWSLAFSLVDQACSLVLAAFNSAPTLLKDASRGRSELVTLLRLLVLNVVVVGYIPQLLLLLVALEMNSCRGSSMLQSSCSSHAFTMMTHLSLKVCWEHRTGVQRGQASVVGFEQHGLCYTTAAVPHKQVHCCVMCERTLRARNADRRYAAAVEKHTTQCSNCVYMPALGPCKQQAGCRFCCCCGYICLLLTLQAPSSLPQASLCSIRSSILS